MDLGNPTGIEATISLHFSATQGNGSRANPCFSTGTCSTKLRKNFISVLRLKPNEFTQRRGKTKLVVYRPERFNSERYAFQYNSPTDENRVNDSNNNWSSSSSTNSASGIRDNDDSTLSEPVSLDGQGVDSLEETLGLLREQVEEDKKKKKQTHSDNDVASSLDLSNAKLFKRSRVLAKQLISQSSARIVGFVSQMWVSARLFKVVTLEVRPSLLSGEIDGVLLDDVCQVGDIVLVSDEDVLQSELTVQDCETLVGYDLVTEDGNYLGKVRDYSFSLQDGNVTSLEFDSLGFSVVPSSLVSTYWLDAEEVVEVFSDNIVVRQGSESRIRRLSKGFWQLGKTGVESQTQKKTRNRRVRRNLVENRQMFPESRQLPNMRRSLVFEEAELEGLDVRQQRRTRRQLRIDEE